MMRLLVTGANGFVGRAVVARSQRETEWRCRAAIRAGALPVDGAEIVRVGDLNDEASWVEALTGVDVVIHSAGRVHVMQNGAGDPLAEYRRVNVDGTAALARATARAGVRRLVFVSSIKALGERSSDGRPLQWTDVPAPEDAYGISKREAEVVLRQVAAETGLDVVIVRPVLVYGPGVVANFRELIRVVSQGWPLPLASVPARRSFVSVDTLADLLVTCARHPAAAGGTFLVSDDEDMTIGDLIQRLARHLGVRTHLFPVPPSLLMVAGRATNRVSLVRRVCDPLQVDISATCATLGWVPPVTVDQALASTVKAYLAMLTPEPLMPNASARRTENSR